MAPEVPSSARDNPHGRHAFVAEADAPRLDVLVATHLDLSRNNAATLIAEGLFVLVGGG
jgi:hypothetical protein